jgi:hypothetical protein
MAVDVSLTNTSADRMLAIVRELKGQGMQLNQDFNFRYEPAQYDNDGWSRVTPKRCVFTFENEKYATLFILKYGQ